MVTMSNGRFERLKKKCMKIRDFLAVMKFQFDTGVTFLVFVNFSLLVITASSKFQEIWNISTLGLWLLFVPMALLGTWLFGFILDKVIKYQQSYYKATHERVPQIMLILENTEKINARLDQLEKQLSR